MNINRLIISGIAGAGMLLAGAMANAAIIVQEGLVGGSGDVDNVISNACNGNNVGPALTVQGCLNTDHDFLVNFTSDENLLMTEGGGQARIVAEDGLFSYLQIWLAAEDYSFSKLQLNINADQDGSVFFTGVPGGDSASFDLSRNGQNQFTITGEDFLSVAFATSVGINSIDLVADLRQVRIGGIQPPGNGNDDPPLQNVSEPAVLFLLGAGLIALAWVRRRHEAV